LSSDAVRRTFVQPKCDDTMATLLNVFAVSAIKCQ
jgi:hypothetical protein